MMYPDYKSRNKQSKVINDIRNQTTKPKKYGRKKIKRGKDAGHPIDGFINFNDFNFDTPDVRNNFNF